MTTLPEIDLSSLAALRAHYAAGLTPEALVTWLDAQITAAGRDEIWITRFELEALRERARELEVLRTAGQQLPLFGVPFAIKDNIDFAGVPTTAGCPQYAYTPEQSAFVVERLIAAGAILLGKMNLDQFATGLVGTRSPYGAVRNWIDPRYVSGGSSSGSAVAVAAGFALFSLGTDTAGSGRVPAAFNAIVGLKPTRGLLSTRGVVPACRSLDCVSIFARTCADAAEVLNVAEGFDAADPYSRAHTAGAAMPGAGFTFGVPREEQLEFFGDESARALFQAAVLKLEAAGGRRVEFDYEPFRRTAELLYGGAWVAERHWAVGDFIATHPGAADPTVEKIISGATRLSARDAFDGLYKLESARRETAPVWQSMDVMVLPTTGTIYTIEAVKSDPIQLNSNLGFYTNFVNLLDLAAIAVPAGVREKGGMPFGISLIAPAFRDAWLCALAGRFGGETEPPQATATPTPTVELAVFGAHLEGLPLNRQLTERNAKLLRRTATSPCYRLYALDNETPPKPALVRAEATGGRIACETWELSVEAFGAFVAEVPPPLAIGTVELEDGRCVKGFVCEPRAIQGAQEITHLGGWRAYLLSKKV